MENLSHTKIGRFYRWWLCELSTILTPRPSATPSWGTILQTTPEGLEVFSGSASQSLGVLKSRSGPDEILALQQRISRSGSANLKRVVLRVSADEVVERTIQIPNAASDVIEPVLQNQMERIVPWPQEMTRYGYRVVGPNALAPDQIDVYFVATTKKIVDSALRNSGTLGLAPKAVEYVPIAAEGVSVKLASLEPDPAVKIQKHIQTAMAMLLAISVGASAFGLYYWWNERSQQNGIEAEIAKTTSRVAELRELNQKSTVLREQREQLVKRRMEQPAIMTLLEALSRTLPDSAYLTELEIEGREARMVGKSDDPTALITELEKTPQFEDVRFSAPTTREAGESRGTFSIIARAQGGPSPEKQP
jgi:general secretion pathway protein L